MSSFISEQRHPGPQQGNFQPSSRLSDSTNILKKVRKLQNKKVLDENDFKNMTNLIKQNHISVLESLSNFFVRLRDQFVLAEHLYEKMADYHPDYKDKSNQNAPIPFSGYFHPNLKMNRALFGQFYECFHKKIKFYQKNPITSYFIDGKDPYARFIIKKAPKIDEINIQFAYPTAYQFFKTLEKFVQIFCNNIDQNLQQPTYHEKEELVIQLIKQQYQMQKTQKNSAQTFAKPFDLLNYNIKLGDHQFYQISSFLQKAKLQASFFSKSGPIQNPVKKQFKSIPIHCIGCTSILYEGKPILRDRSSITRYQVVKSVKDYKSRLKDLIEGFMNSPNGGIILFDCDEYLFEIYPRGYETNLKDFEYRRQSLNDSCKNYFKDFQVDRDYTIDFVILHNQNGSPIVNEVERQNTSFKTEFFITRLKVFGRKVTSELKLPDADDKRYDRKESNNKYFTKQVGNFDLQTIDYEEMKMRFYKNQSILSHIDKPQYYNKIRKAFYNNENKINELLRGRNTPFLLHENYQCKASQIVMISSGVGKSENKEY